MQSYSPSGEARFRISSGTEDYFLDTFYFDKGQYFFPEAGVTSVYPPTAPTNPPSVAAPCGPFSREGPRKGDVRRCPWPSRGVNPTKGTLQWSMPARSPCSTSGTDKMK